MNIKKFETFWWKAKSMNKSCMCGGLLEEIRTTFGVLFIGEFSLKHSILNGFPFFKNVCVWNRLFFIRFWMRIYHFLYLWKIQLNLIIKSSLALKWKNNLESGLNVRIRYIFKTQNASTLNIPRHFLSSNAR